MPPEDENTLEIHPVVKQAFMDEADTADMGEAMYEAITKRWQFFCPWCGKPAMLNTVKPITINCDECEATSKIAVIT